MKLRQLFDDDNAVSPVIGVILMVAITVILAAVIATFVLGLGEQVSDTAPQASFTFDYEEADNFDSYNLVNPGDTGDATGVLTIRHGGGATIKADQLGITGATGAAGSFDWTDGDASYETGSDISAGDSIEVAVSDEDTVQLVWTNDEGTNSATLQEWTGPQA